MNTRLLIVTTGLLLAIVIAPRVCADELEMQNGDRYFGTVLSVSADTVLLDSDVLGKINVPRKQVVNLAFGVKAAPPKADAPSAPFPALTNLGVASPPPALALTNLDFAAALRNLGADTNFIGQIRQKLLAGNAAAASNYDAMVSGLLNGTLNLGDLRQQAQSAVDQLRKMKRDLGSAAGSSVDGYLEVLENFLNETAGGATNAASAPRPTSQTP